MFWELHFWCFKPHVGYTWDGDLCFVWSQNWERSLLHAFSALAVLCWREMWAPGNKTCRLSRAPHRQPHQTFRPWTTGLPWGGEGQPPCVYHGLPSDPGPLWVYTLDTAGLFRQNWYLFMNVLSRSIALYRRSVASLWKCWVQKTVLASKRNVSIVFGWIYQHHVK